MFPDATMTALANAALRQVQRRHDWRWLETSEAINTANGDRDYPVAATYRRTLLLTNPDGEPVRRESLEFVDLLQGASGAVPKFYAISGSLLLLAPVPTGVVALTHRFLRIEAVLVADADTPLLPTVWDDAIVEYMAYLMFRRQGSAAEAGAALAAHEAIVQEMLEEAGAASKSKGGGDQPEETKA